MNISKNGFTIVELLVVMGILLVLFGFVVIGLTKTERTFSTSSSKEIIVSDLKLQQVKAMQGVGGSFGIYFQPDRYTLFSGNSYSSSDPDNFEVTLNEGIVVSDITFPASTVVFATMSGKINNFVDGSNTIILQDVQGTKTINIKLNRYGVIIEAN